MRLAVLTALLAPATHALAITPGEDALGRAPPILPVPKRALEWGDVNFISTSDTHGWLLGHQHNTWPEPNYSGDWGSYASFATHMRAEADARGVDLLLVDAGDHHDGSGLVSSSPRSAERADEIFAALEYDVLAIGNHELYKYESARWIYDHRARWGGRFLTSNVNITVEQGGKAVSVPIAHRFAKFATKQGRQVTAFGVLFSFKAHDRNLTIQSPTKMAQEEWFQDAIADAPDYFVLVGHMPARGWTGEWRPVFDAIRAVHPLVPVYIFGGHTHVRDCTQYDDRSIAVVPGRYLETIAFTSSSLPPADDDGSPLVMNRRYLDANPVTYKFHSNKTDDDFDTPLGRNITDALGALSKDLNLSQHFGTSPHDYFLSRHPYGHPRSILTMFAEKVLPAAVQDKHRKGPRIILGNAGSLRFDLFKGTFDRNDELTVSPFTTAFLYTRLPAGLARIVVDQMNRAGASKLQPVSISTQEDDDAYVRRVYNEWLSEQWEEHVREEQLAAANSAQMPFGSKVPGKPHTMGYVTRDACRGKGDDIEHIPVPFTANQPDFIQTPMPELDDDEELDVVVMDFAMDDFLAAIHVLDPHRKLSLKDFQPYAEGTLINEVLGTYASMAWA